MSHVVTLERACGQRTNDQILSKQLDFIIGRALGGNRGKNWTVRKGRIKAKQQVDEQWLFNVDLTFDRTSGHKGTEDKQWADVTRYLIQAGSNSQFNKYPWKVARGIDNAEAIAAEIAAGPELLTESDIKVEEPKDYSNINLDMGDRFDHIYDRQYQLQILHSSLKAAKMSNFNNRYHTVVFGPPGCGKTDTLLTTADMLGKEGEAYMKFDATSTTEAGASKILLDSPIVPPVLIVEEIEKASEHSLRWLLGVMDQRGEIRRTNYRIGNRSRSVKMVVLATVNDIKLFRNVMSGALASRFPNQIYFPRPSREILGRILEREVAKAGGRPEWIEPTLQFCYDKMHWDDPRKLVPVCLCGQDDLLNGTYQTALENTQLPVDIEKQLAA